MLILYLLMSYVAIRKARPKVRRNKRMYDSASNTMVSRVLVLVHRGEVLRDRPCTTTSLVYVQ